MSAVRPLCPPRPLRFPAGYRVGPTLSGFWRCFDCGELAIAQRGVLVYGHACPPSVPVETPRRRRADKAKDYLLGLGLALAVFAAWWVTVTVR